MNMVVIKETKHRSTIAPFGCDHCGYIWYGWTSSIRYAPGHTLCTKCYLAFYAYIEGKYDDLLHTFCKSDEERTEILRPVLADALEWIQNKNNKPRPRPAEKRFHSSVPKWLRSAISQGMVTPGGKEVYVVHSIAQVATRVDLVDRSTLRPFKMR
jgi:hypothetical protein